MARNFLPEELIDDVARRFRALSEPIRLRILRLLQTGELSVNDVAAQLESGQSNISRHLHALYEAGLVSRRREGAATLYSIQDPVVGRLCDLMCRDAVKKAHGRLRQIVKVAGG